MSASWWNTGHLTASMENIQQKVFRLGKLA